jgi:ferredoxin
MGPQQPNNTVMPNLEDRLPQNAPGRFYVDSSCIDCDLCRGNASDFFRRNDDIGFSIVLRQPVSDAEIQSCLEALEGCPTESIGQMVA